MPTSSTRPVALQTHDVQTFGHCSLVNQRLLITEAVKAKMKNKNVFFEANFQCCRVFCWLCINLGIDISACDLSQGLHLSSEIRREAAKVRKCHVSCISNFTSCAACEILLSTVEQFFKWSQITQGMERLAAP
jgi:hypothetical protein